MSGFFIGSATIASPPVIYAGVGMFPDISGGEMQRHILAVDSGLTVVEPPTSVRSRNPVWASSPKGTDIQEPPTEEASPHVFVLPVPVKDPSKAHVWSHPLAGITPKPYRYDVKLMPMQDVLGHIKNAYSNFKFTDENQKDLEKYSGWSALVALFNGIKLVSGGINPFGIVFDSAFPELIHVPSITSTTNTIKAQQVDIGLFNGVTQGVFYDNPQGRAFDLVVPRAIRQTVTLYNDRVFALADLLNPRPDQQVRSANMAADHADFAIKGISDGTD